MRAAVDEVPKTRAIDGGQDHAFDPFRKIFYSAGQADMEPANEEACDADARKEVQSERANGEQRPFLRRDRKYWRLSKLVEAEAGEAALEIIEGTDRSRDAQRDDAIQTEIAVSRTLPRQDPGDA